MARAVVLQDAAPEWATGYGTFTTARPPVVIDVAFRLNGSNAQTVLYTFPTTIEHVYVLDFTATVSQDGPAGMGGGTNTAMYKVMSRFRYPFAGSLTHIATVYPVYSETDSSMDISLDASGSDIRILGTPASTPVNPNYWFFRLYGHLFEMPCPVAP